MFLRLFLLAALAGCSSLANGERLPDTPLAALADKRHGHRIEPLPDGHLCFGGFGKGAKDRGTHETSFLPHGGSQWQARAPLTHAHSFFASARIDGSIYAIGESVERYDAANDTWDLVVPLGRLPKSHFGAASVGHEIFVLGGFPEIGTGFSIVDSRTGVVTEAAPPSSFRHGDHFHFVCELNGELHVIGGIDGETFDMQTNHWVRRNQTWHALPACPEGLWTKFAAHVMHKGKLYVFGDFGAYCYDPTASTWQERAKMPHLIAMPVAVATESDLWVLGGMQGKLRGNVFLRYEIDADRWHDLAAPKPQ